MNTAISTKIVSSLSAFLLAAGAGCVVAAWWTIGLLPTPEGWLLPAISIAPYVFLAGAVWKFRKRSVPALFVLLITGTLVAIGVWAWWPTTIKEDEGLVIAFAIFFVSIFQLLLSMIVACWAGIATHGKEKDELDTEQL